MLQSDNSIPSISDTHVSHLLDMGDWTPEERLTIDAWSAKPYGINAAKAIIESLRKILEGDHVSDPNKFIKSKIAHFETLVSTVRSGFKNEYYQEHLSHMLRVTLLARAVGNEKNLNLDHNQIKQLTIAALVHDIAYPLSYSQRVFNEIKNSLEDCYNCGVFTDPIISYKIGEIFENIQYILDENHTFADYFIHIGKSLNDNDHGVLSAIEFLTYLKPDKRESYRDAAFAIAAHNYDGPFKKLSYEKNPIAVLLILCDELQEEGRLIGQDTEPVLKKFSLNLDDGIRCFFDYSIGDKGPSFSGKVKNLQRIDFRTFKCPLVIRTKLSIDYNSLDISYLVICMEELFNNYIIEEHFCKGELLHLLEDIIKSDNSVVYDFYAKYSRGQSREQYFKKNIDNTETPLSVYFRDVPGLDFFIGYNKPTIFQISLNPNEELSFKVGFNDNQYTNCEILSEESMKNDSTFKLVKYLRDVLSILIIYQLVKYHENRIIDLYNDIRGKHVNHINDVLFDKTINMHKKLLSLIKVYESQQNNPKYLLEYYIIANIGEQERKEFYTFCEKSILTSNVDITVFGDVATFMKIIKKFHIFYKYFENEKTLFVKNHD